MCKYASLCYHPTVVDAVPTQRTQQTSKLTIFDILTIKKNRKVKVKEEIIHNETQKIGLFARSGRHT
jgi:hypothetical protein